MIPGAIAILVLIAFALTLLNGTFGKPPLWIAVLLLCIVHLILLVGK